MQVAICDDERIFIEQLHEMVEKTGSPMISSLWILTGRGRMKTEYSTRRR